MGENEHAFLIVRRTFIYKELSAHLYWQKRKEKKERVLSLYIYKL